MNGLRTAARWTVASVWLCEGLWCKVLGRSAQQRSIVDSVPFLSHSCLTGAVVAIGLLETGVAFWVLTGSRPLWAAVVQTLLVVGFNAGGLAVAADRIADPVRLLTRNAAFLALVWLQGPVSTWLAGPRRTESRSEAP